MSNIKPLSTLASQWYRLRSSAHGKSCEEIIREYRRLEHNIACQKAESAQEALTQLRIAVILWQETAIQESASGFLKQRRNAMFLMFRNVLGFLDTKADTEIVG